MSSTEPLAPSSLERLLAPHPSSSLEYWFFKVNQVNGANGVSEGSVALLVDWIARRKHGEYVLRASIYSPYRRAVLFEKLPSPMVHGQNFITTQRTAGQTGDLSWALDITCENERIEPDIFPARLLRMADLSLVSAPVVAFTGWVRHGPFQVELTQSPGMIAHYWGRQLAQEWWWVSANHFDRGEIAVECALFRTRLWGLPVRIQLGYLYLRRAGTPMLMMSPPAMAHAKGTPEKFEIKFQRPGARSITLKAQGLDYGDLGDGITNTLVGDLDIWEGSHLIAQAKGTAALERRVPFSR